MYTSSPNTHGLLVFIIFNLKMSRPSLKNDATCLIIVIRSNLIYSLFMDEAGTATKSHLVASTAGVEVNSHG